MAQETVEKLDHTEVIDAAVSATCAVTGLTEGKHCSVCNDVIVAQETVEKLDHTEVIDVAVAATCTTTGLTEGKHCSVCNTVIVNQTTVEKLPHTEVVDEAVSATCASTGLTEGKHCSVCNTIIVAQEETSISDCIGGNWKVVLEPTRITDGIYQNLCSTCGEMLQEVVGGMGSQGLSYSLNVDRESYCVTGIGNCTDTDLLIPSIYNGLPVTKIYLKAFNNCTLLTSVEIPNSVKDIGEYAFYDCSSLVSVTIPESIMHIGYEAFYGCNSISDVYYTGEIDGWLGINFGLHSNPVCYATNLYIGEEIVTSITVPDTITSIGEYSFYKYKSLKSVTIGNSVTSIGESSFYNCYSLETVTIGNSVASIGSSAFENCTSLTSIEIPDSVTTIGSSAFENCTSLTSIEIPDSVTSIDSYAFSECTSLTSVTIPSSVTSIGNFVFSQCTLLTSIEIPDSVTSIDVSAFYRCTSLTNIEVDENNENYKSIDGHLYSKDGKTLIRYAGGKQDMSFTIPDGVTSIDSDAFSDCTSLTSLTIPNSVTIISDSAFRWCQTLTSITIPDSVTSIGEGAFYHCTSLEGVTIGKSVKNIGDGAFLGCFELTDIYVDINNQYYKSMGGNLYTKDGKTLIKYAVGKKSTIFTIPNSVTHIGQSSFEHSNLRNIIIPDSVISIDSYAFAYSHELERVTIGNSVKSISYDAFDCCISLQNINVDINNKYYQSVDGNLYTKDGKELIKYAIGKTDTSFTVPDSVTLICNNAFYSDSNYHIFLTSVTIPNSITNIGFRAFWDCTVLTSITFGGTVEEWNAIEKDEYWNFSVPATSVICSDGTVSLK